LRLVLLGPPGAGKGTLAGKIAEKYGVVHLSTGEMLRAAIAEGSALGRAAKEYVEAGRLVPQEVLADVVASRLGAANGFVLDGYPRTVEQAAFLAQLPDAAPDAVVYVAVPPAEAVRRLEQRRVCGVCGAPAAAGDGGDVCERCGGKLHVRADDRPATIKKRYEVYLRETEPLVEYYRAAGVLREIDGVGGPEEVLARLEAAVAPLTPCPRP
jgi:adenylate kinase